MRIEHKIEIRRGKERKTYERIVSDNSSGVTQHQVTCKTTYFFEMRQGFRIKSLRTHKLGKHEQKIFVEFISRGLYRRKIESLFYETCHAFHHIRFSIL